MLERKTSIAARKLCRPIVADNHFGACDGLAACHVQHRPVHGEAGAVGEILGVRERGNGSRADREAGEEQEQAACERVRNNRTPGNRKLMIRRIRTAECVLKNTLNSPNCNRCGLLRPL